MNIIAGFFIFLMIFLLSLLLGLVWLVDQGYTISSFIGISSFFIASVTLIVTILLGRTWSNLDSAPLEEKDIVSIENNIESFKISNAVLKYNNDSETEVDVVSIEALEDYEYVLIKYRLKSGKLYLNKSKLELRKKEK